MSQTRRKVDISGSLPQSSGKQVWTGSRSLHRLGWICAVYPGRTRLRSVPARRLQHQVSGCTGSGSFQICRSERRRVGAIQINCAVWEHGSNGKKLSIALFWMGSCKKRMNSNSLCVPAELNTRTTRLPASGRRKRELPPGSLGETPTCDMQTVAATGTGFHGRIQRRRSDTRHDWLVFLRDVEADFPAFRRNAREISFTVRCPCKR